MTGMTGPASEEKDACSHAIVSLQAQTIKAHGTRRFCYGKPVPIGRCLKRAYYTPDTPGTCKSRWLPVPTPNMPGTPGACMSKWLVVPNMPDTPGACMSKWLIVPNMPDTPGACMSRWLPMTCLISGGTAVRKAGGGHTHAQQCRWGSRWELEVGPYSRAAMQVWKLEVGPYSRAAM
eukprot:1161427-Pelagomonas_calceolata.AAC.1